MTRRGRCPTPRRALDKQIRAARDKLGQLEQRFGAAAADNPEGRRPTMPGFKIAHGQLGKELRRARERLARLLERRRGLPRRVEVRHTSPGAVLKLATERKHLSDLVKMVAYQAESDLVALLGPRYARADDEGRTLIHELFQAAANLEVGEQALQVTLHPLSSPHRTLAVAALCEPLNETATAFPGSRLRVHFAVHAPPARGLAFPGARTSAGPGRPLAAAKPDISAPG